MQGLFTDAWLTVRLQTEGIATLLERGSHPSFVIPFQEHAEDIRHRLCTIRDKWKPFIVADLVRFRVWAFDGKDSLRYLPADDRELPMNLLRTSAL